MLTRHHRVVPIVDDRMGGVAGGKGIRHSVDPHKMVDRNPAEPVAAGIFSPVESMAPDRSIALTATPVRVATPREASASSIT
jgi:hypothetical protein